MPPCFKVENDFAGPVAGVDEVGRGPLAGPVVAAAVILDRRRFPRGIDDSKKLSLEARETICARLENCARIGIGIATVEEIDRLNILWATMLAMRRAIDAIGGGFQTVLVDGNRCPDWPHSSHALVGGDARSRSIAAASIVAKVTRDRMMAEADLLHPGYGWGKNKGYGTPDHMAALTSLGPTPLHRRSFAPVRKAWELIAG